MFSQGVVTTAPPYSHLRLGSQSGHAFFMAQSGHIQEYGEGSGHGHKCNFTLLRAEERHYTIYIRGGGGGGGGGVPAAPRAWDTGSEGDR